MVSLAHGTEDLEHFEAFYQAGIPIVFFDKIPRQFQKTSTVTVDDYLGAYNTVSHLIEQGKRKIAHFRGPLQASTSRNRLNGYLDALKAHHIPVDESLIFACEEIQSGRSFRTRTHHRA